MCMTMRGVEKPGAITATVAYTGAFRDNAQLRTEFLLQARGAAGVSGLAAAGGHSGAGSSSIGGGGPGAAAWSAAHCSGHGQRELAAGPSGGSGAVGATAVASTPTTGGGVGGAAAAADHGRPDR
jgi:hypothetical protein